MGKAVIKIGDMGVIKIGVIKKGDSLRLPKRVIKKGG